VASRFVPIGTLCTLLLTTTLLSGCDPSSRSAPNSSLRVSTSQLLDTVGIATEASKRARLSAAVVLVRPNCHRSTTSYSGTIDFQNASSSLEVTSATGISGGCEAVVGSQMRQFRNVIYLGSPIHPVVSGPTYQPCCTVNGGSSSGKIEWVVEHVGLQGYGASGSSILLTPFPLVLLRAAAKAMPHSRFEPTDVTKLSITVSLAQLQTEAEKQPEPALSSLAGFRSLPTAEPNPNSIPVSVSVWLDSQKRLVRLEASQPWFTLTLPDGSTQGGTEFDKIPPGAIVSSSPTGSVTVTDEFFGYGHASEPSAPNVGAAT